jgi:formylglycine-generating enzyme required for sulfatase activity
VSDAVEAVFAKALAVAPEQRYRSMGQFWSDLQRAVFPDNPTTWPGVTLGRASISSSLRPGSSATPTPPVVTIAAESKPPAHESTPSAQVGEPAKRTGLRRGLIASGLALLALTAGITTLTTMRALRANAPVLATTSPAPSAMAPGAPAGTSAVITAVTKPGECPAGMVLVPGGRFFMGSDDPAFKLWQPAHKVALDAFCIDIYEVTAGDYKACSDRGECKRPEVKVDYPKGETTSETDHERNKTAYAELCNFGKEGREKHPMNCVSWALAEAYCIEQKKRLPTEAEWEYAARGSDGRKFPWGEDHGDERYMNACGRECTAWEVAHHLRLSTRMYEADDGYAGTAPVGSFPLGKTKFGAHDFIGNVWEWTADWFQTYSSDEVINPVGAPAGDRKAIRGGGFNGGTELWLNPAFRYHQLATASSHGIGFRCAANL